MTSDTRRTRRDRRAVAVLAAGLALAGATSVVLVPVLSRGRAGDAPVVHIHEPRAWAAESGNDAPSAPVDVAVGPRRSVPIRGIARHTGPIRDVRLGGLRLAMLSRGDPSVVEFSGFFDTRDLDPDGAITLEARGVGGAATTLRLPVAVDPRPGQGPDFGDVDRGERSQRWAVVVGAGSHADRRLAGLTGAAADARAIAAFLRSPAAGLGGFPESHLRLLTGEQATGRNIRSALKTFLRTATPGDMVLIYLAGRVVADPDGRPHAYLLAYDTEPGDIPATAVDLRFVADAVEEVYGHTRMVVADLALEPGAAPRARDLLLERTVARQGGLAVVLSGGGARLGPRLLEGLGGAADEDDDRVVRLGELVAHVERAGASAARTSYDRSWPMAAVRVTTAAAAPARRPDR